MNYDLTYKFVKQNYNYLFLDAQIKKAKTDTALRTLVAGSSYALYGIDIYALENAVNCSMHSQDMYYNLLCLRTALGENSGFERCLIIAGYYNLCFDLSRSPNEAKRYIERVYFPVFGERHHYVGAGDYDFWKDMPDCPEAERDEILREVVRMLQMRGNYFSDLRKRRPWQGFTGSWSALVSEEKTRLAMERAALHNRQARHTESFLEGCALLTECVALCRQRGVEPIIVIPPFTKDYNRYIDDSMREDFIAGLERLKVQFDVRVVDFNTTDYFTDDDFIDTDHLNGRGAYKLSKLISRLYT